jgi:hypothetical protein
MKFLAVHPSCLMYSKIYLRLEPLGLELVAAAAERAGHSVQLIDLQCDRTGTFSLGRTLAARLTVAFCGNYLANVQVLTSPSDPRPVAGRLYLRWQPRRLIYSQRDLRRRCRGLRVDGEGGRPSPGCWM